MYERLIKEIKKTVYKTLGNTHLTFGLLEAVVMDIEKHLNNQPLTYVESDEGGPQTLTPNVLMWGQNAHKLEDIEIDNDEVTKLHRPLKSVRDQAWRPWQKEYVHRLIEAHRVNRNDKLQMPEIHVGEIVLVVGKEPTEVNNTTSKEPDRSVATRKAADNARAKIELIGDHEFELD